MKILYFECGMGAAGDMLTAALVDLYPDRESVVAELNALNIPGVEYCLTDSVKCGITGRHMDVIVNGEREGEHDHHEHDHHHDHHQHEDHDHHHEHDHEHTHTHSHTSLHDIEHIIADLKLPEAVEKDAIAVYRELASAESEVHGVPITDIHFHEVGTMDAVADIVAVCYLINKLGADEIVSSPVNTGSGSVKCAHGVLPVPAPATARILRGVPMYSDGITGELTTPTGAALLKHFVRHFEDMPRITVDAIGCGMGKKDFPKANCVRAFLGEGKGSEDVVLELSCNVDDMTAEAIGYATERLLEGGAFEVYTVAVGMKKNRPGTLIRVICSPKKKDDLVRLIFKHTTTIGVRETVTYRNVLDREIKTYETPYGPVRVKYVTGYGVSRSKAEYDDLVRIARENDISLQEARDLVSQHLK